MEKSDIDEGADLEAYLFHRHSRRDTSRGIARDLTIRTDDGASLAATVFESPHASSRVPPSADPHASSRVAPSADPHASSRVAPSADPGANRGALVIAGGTGVLRRFYAPFATWLATEGFTVVTFDYRGIGGSRAVEAGLPPTLRAWGEQDLAAVLSWTADVYGGGEVGLVGHSVGGQLVGLLPESVHARTTSIVTIASQSGDYRLWPMPMRLAMAALWWGIVPGVTRAMGYLPGSLGIGQDLPAGVALEWAEWCRTPGYLVGVDDDDTSERRRSGFARVRVPLLAFSFHDDTYAPPAAVDALLDLYTNADVRRRHLDRSDGRFGHFGFFRSRHRALWREISAHFEASLAGDR